MTDFFTTFDQKGFALLQKLNEQEQLFTSLEYTPQMCRVDALATDKLGNKYVIEVKIRDFPSSQFDTAVIDTSKLNYLKLQSYEGYIPLYICFYSNQIAICWNISTTEPNLTEKRQIFNKGLNKMQEKCLSYFTICSGINYKYN